MEIELKIEGKNTGDSMLFATLSINGEAGVGRTRLRWTDCGQLIAKLGFYVSTRSLSPDDCAELLTDLAFYAQRSDPQRKRDFGRLSKRFRNLARKLRSE